MKINEEPRDVDSTRGLRDPRGVSAAAARESSRGEIARAAAVLPA